MSKDKVISVTCKECGKEWFSDDKDSWMQVPWCCRQHMISDPDFSKVVWARSSERGAPAGACRICNTPMYEHRGVPSSGGMMSSYYFGNLNECCKDPSRSTLWWGL